MEKRVLLNVEGMDCANCALSITRTLQKSGLKDVSVNFATGEVLFEVPEKPEIETAVSNIRKLGYQVVARSDIKQSTENTQEHGAVHYKATLRKFIVALIFTVPLIGHMFLPFPILHSSTFQLILALPVLYIGITHFGKSAFYSVRAGVPNMDVLIVIGSTAAFVYSVAGMLLKPDTIHNYLFFETGATIVTLVLFGNLIEQRSVKQTTTALKDLSDLQPEKAKKIVVTGESEKTEIVNSELLVVGDLIQVNNGDRIPLDGQLISGSLLVDESMITGESIPVLKSDLSVVTGGTLILEGNGRIIITHTKNESTLSKIIDLVKIAQNQKPDIQKLGDKISAIFVPIVLIISALTFLLSYFAFHINLSQAFLSSIAVLVISCPCAMGLATPTAVIVGIGRAAKNGILIKGGSTLEELAKINCVVFDKTGTLTTGNFKIQNIQIIDKAFSIDELKKIIYSAEVHSSHPIAKSIVRELPEFSNDIIKWKTIQEDKGIGMNVTDETGNIFSVGSFQIVKHFYDDLQHSIYVLKNNKLIGTIDIEDEIKNDVKELISKLKEKGIKSVLVSGDKKERCLNVAEKCGIENVFYEKLPSQKSEIISQLMQEGKVAMLGDGINDAPALAQASVGISISDSSDIAIQSAQIILLDKKEMMILFRAITISQLTYQTIKQNLFWAFFYNVIAIPIAALGMLNPMIGALSMAFSDVIVIGNSLRLKSRKI